MELSVVVPTLNGREQLGGCLDALTEHTEGVETVVVNGPSADGTTGMVKARDDVDMLVEISDRNVNVARNAGLASASHDNVAIVSYDRQVSTDWFDIVTDRFKDGAAVVTGPSRGGRNGQTEPTDRLIGGRTVKYCNGGNMALSAEVVDALDGFDERIAVGGARDLSHRLAGHDFEVVWETDASVSAPCATDGGSVDHDRRELYFSLSYQLAKNYGLRPSAIGKSLWDAGGDAVRTAIDVLRGNDDPSNWLGEGRSAVTGLASGYRHGLRARLDDRTPRRNPNGISARKDRAVRAYDWR